MVYRNFLIQSGKLYKFLDYFTKPGTSIIPSLFVFCSLHHSFILNMKVRIYLHLRSFPSLGPSVGILGIHQPLFLEFFKNVFLLKYITILNYCCIRSFVEIHLMSSIKKLAIPTGVAPCGIGLYITND